MGLNPTQIGGILRAVVICAGTIAATLGYMSGVNFEALAGSLAALAMAGWSVHTNKTSQMVAAVAATADKPDGVKAVVMNTTSAADAIPAPNVVGPGGH